MLTLSEIIAKETGASVIVVGPKSELLIARGEGDLIVQPETQD
jgi:hypothetical protein